jgi:hypothetical protein
VEHGHRVKKLSLTRKMKRNNFFCFNSKFGKMLSTGRRMFAYRKGSFNALVEGREAVKKIFEV